MESTEPAYAAGSSESGLLIGGPRPLPDSLIAAAAVGAALAACSPIVPIIGWSVVLVALMAYSWFQHRLRSVVVLATFTMVLILTARSWNAFVPIERVDASGWARVVTDPDRRGPAVVVVIEFEGRRYGVRAYGRVGRRLAKRTAGEWVLVDGRLGPLTGSRRINSVANHLVGEFQVDRAGDVLAPGPALRAANRLRRLLSTTAARSMPAPDAALFLGLIIGDDREEPDAMVQSFRASGLSHLTAVSGQNVAFVLVAASPLLRRLRPAPRWVASAGLIGWFALLTRLEPSVLRAGVMAVLTATAFWRGWRASTLRLLSLTVIVLFAVDPLLALSVGWWMSVSATLGIAVLGPVLRARMPGPDWVRVVLSTSLAAQLGTVPISVAIFGRAPIVGLPANFLATPIAGLVMVIGVPTTILAAIVRFEPLVDLLQLPSRVGTRWVWVVARLGERIEPSGIGRWAGVVHLLGLAMILRRPARTIDPLLGPERADVGSGRAARR